MSRLDAHADEIKQALDSGATRTAVAKQFGVARSTLVEWLSKPAPKPPAEDDGITEAELLRAELSEVKRIAKKARALDIQAERVLLEIHEAVQAAPPVYAPLEPEDYDGRPHSQALLFSDTHAGEIVDSEAVSGINHYDWDTCVERVWKVQQSLLSFQANRPYPISELQVWCLGDMLSGANHPEISETNEFPPAEQAFRFGMLLGQFVEELIPHYPRLSVVGVVGNHPRAVKAPANKQVFNNFDWMAYKIAEAYLAKYIEAGSVTCNFPRAGFLVQEIAGNNVLLFHGDGIRSSMPGVPWGGVTRRTNELKKQYAEMGTMLHGFALGHFHQANVVQGSVFMNGSLKGPDEYTLKQFGGGEKPTQLLLTYDDQRARLTDVSFITP